MQVVPFDADFHYIDSAFIYIEERCNWMTEPTQSSPMGKDKVNHLDRPNFIQVYLTRFNKIATQGAPQMAVDKEANSLSRVYS